jgi:hypothetical protein
MTAAHLIAAHNAAMERCRRVMIDEQTFEGRRENLARANKRSRTFATRLEALTEPTPRQGGSAEDDGARRWERPRPAGWAPQRIGGGASSLRNA